MRELFDDVPSYDRIITKQQQIEGEGSKMESQSLKELKSGY